MFRDGALNIFGLSLYLLAGSNIVYYFYLRNLNELHGRCDFQSVDHYLANLYRTNKASCSV